MLGTITKNDFFNHNRKFGVKAKMLTAISATADLEVKLAAEAFVMLCDGMLDTINIGDTVTQEDLTLLVVAGFYTQEMRDHLEGLATTQQQTQITPTVKTIPYPNGNPTFTLNQALTQTKSVTFWGLKAGYKPENLGRAIHVNEALKYNVDLSGKHGFDELEIRVNASGVDFTVSA
jgi:hypothetical protein